MSATPPPVIVFEVNILPLEHNPNVNLLCGNTCQEVSTMSFVPRILKHGDQFTLHGMEAIRIKKDFTDGVIDSYTSQPLKLISINYASESISNDVATGGVVCAGDAIEDFVPA